MLWMSFLLLACGEKDSQDGNQIEDTGSAENVDNTDDTNDTNDTDDTSDTSDTSDTEDPENTDVDQDGVNADQDCDDLNPWVSTDCNRACTGEFKIETNEDLSLVAGCQSIEGDLNIDGIDQNDLIALHSLESVSGDLWFFRVTNLTNMHGLENLQSIGGGLIISYNDTLENIDALASLNSIGETLTMTNNPLLSNLSGFSSLHTIGGSILLDGLNITDLNGFSNVNTVGSSIYVSDCPSLTSLIGVSTSLQSFGEHESIGTYDPDYGLIESLLYVYNNEALCVAEIDATTAALENMGWEGRAIEFGNASCN